MNLFKKKVNRDGWPAWAIAMNDLDYPSFIGAFESFFQEHNWQYQIENDREGVRILSGPMEDMGLGFHNIGARCRGLKPNEIKQEVYSWISHFWDVKAEGDQFSDCEFDYCKSILKIRIYEIYGDVEDQCKKVLANNLAAYVVFDMNLSMKSATQSDFDKWNMTFEEVFDFAYRQTMRELEQVVDVDILDDEHFSGVSIITAEESLLVATCLLDLEKFIEGPKENGYIATVPKRDMMYAVPLTSSFTFDNIDWMSKLASFIYEKDEGSLSPHVYWVRGNEILELEMGAPRYARPLLDQVAVLAGWKS